MRPDGRPVAGNSPADTSIAAGPEFVADWVKAMKKQFPRLFAEGRVIFALGNEPMLWHITHKDVHPDPVSYDEYLQRFVAMTHLRSHDAPSGHAMRAHDAPSGRPMRAHYPSSHATNPEHRPHPR